MRYCCISSLDLVLTGLIVDGLLPTYFLKLLQSKQITNTQYTILENLWNWCIEQITEYIYDSETTKLSLTMFGSVSYLMQLSDVTKIPFKVAIRQLQQKGILKLYTKNNSISGVELSSRIFKKLIKWETNKGNSVNLLQVMYPDKYTVYDEIRIGNRFIDKIAIYDRFVNVRNPVFYNYNEDDDVIMKRIPIKFKDKSELKTMIEHAIEREPITGLRQPIIQRTPIISRKSIRKINFNAKKYKGLTDSQKREIEKIAHLGQEVIDRKLERFKDIQSKAYTDDELDCLYDFIPYYENLICEQCDMIEYSLLNNKRFPKRSKNWKALYKIFMMCKEKGWDYRIYLESQFKAYTNWTGDSKTAVKYPMPNMLYSERAARAYEAYIYDEETSYQNEGYDIKVHSKDVGNYQEQVEERVRNSIKCVLSDMKSYTSKYCTIFDSVDEDAYDILSVMKTKSVFDRWSDPDLPSIEYLSQVPGILDLVSNMIGISPKIDLKINELEQLVKNQVKMEIVNDTVRKLEKKYKMPKFVDITMLNQILYGSRTMNTGELW